MIEVLAVVAAVVVSLALIFVGVLVWDRPLRDYRREEFERTLHKASNQESKPCAYHTPLYVDGCRDCADNNKE